jgi:hypothetical protein
MGEEGYIGMKMLLSMRDSRANHLCIQNSPLVSLHINHSPIVNTKTTSTEKIPLTPFLVDNNGRQYEENEQRACRGIKNKIMLMESSLIDISFI